MKLERNLSTSNVRFGEQDRRVAKAVLDIVAATRRLLKQQELGLTYVLAEDSPDRWPGFDFPSREELRRCDGAYEYCGKLLRYDPVTDTKFYTRVCKGLLKTGLFPTRAGMTGGALYPT